MNKFDERLSFYMRNRKVIEEWAAIGRSVPEAAHRFLARHAQDVQRIASEDVVGAVPVVRLDQAHPQLALARPSWGTEDTRGPIVVIGIEWPKKSVNLFSSHPYVGVWVDRERDSGRQLHDAIAHRCEEKAKEHDYKPHGWYPCCRHIPPPNPEFWEDLAPISRALLESLTEAWHLFHECVEHAVAGTELGT